MALHDRRECVWLWVYKNYTLDACQIQVLYSSFYLLGIGPTEWDNDDFITYQHTHTCAHMCLCAHTFTHACMHTCMHAHTHACMCAHTNTHTPQTDRHTDTHTHTHTHTHTYSPLDHSFSHPPSHSFNQSVRLYRMNRHESYICSTLLKIVDRTKSVPLALHLHVLI